MRIEMKGYGNFNCLFVKYSEAKFKLLTETEVRIVRLIWPILASFDEGEVKLSKKQFTIDHCFKGQNRENCQRRRLKFETSFCRINCFLTFAINKINIVTGR